MASLLAKFRIEYSDLQIMPDITKPASEKTKALFESLIADFRSQNTETATTEKDTSELLALTRFKTITMYFPVTITDSELMAIKEKSNRQMRLRELLLEHSQDAELVVVTLPIPRKNVISAATYLAWLELLTRDMPPVLLVRGNQTSVLTFYS